ncbi:MAG: hypothetical protein ACLPKB_20830 [Xanthobacteraceae bacterium]
MAEITLKRLWGRKRVPDDFLREVQEWLFRARWVLFYAGATYGLVQAQVVESWPRVTSKRIEDDLKKVTKGQFDFSHYHALILEGEDESDETD